MGKAQPAAAPVTDGKRVIKLDPIRNVRIQLPDQSFHDFGDDLRSMLVTSLTAGGNFIVAEDQPPLPLHKMMALAAPGPSPTPPPAYEWQGTFVPAGTVKIEVDALTFATGSRGERMLYGFDERFRTPYNDGISGMANEFPLRDVAFEPSWFDAFFNDKGVVPWDARSGLDIGDGFQIDATMASLAVKWAVYRSDLHLNITVTPSYGGEIAYKRVIVSGQGFFFDVAGGYEGYSAGITIARRDAMNLAVQNALTGSYDAIVKAVGVLPLAARIDGILADGTILLGTGRDAGVAVGTQFEVVSDTREVVSVTESVASGSLAKLVSGSLAALKPGLIVRQVVGGSPVSLAPGQPGRPLQGAAKLASVRAAEAVGSGSGSGPGGGTPIGSVGGIDVQTVDLPWTNLPKSDLKGTTPAGNIWEDILLAALKASMLPYRIARYFEYDQDYRSQPDPSTGPSSWEGAARAEPWAKQIGLDVAAEMPDAGEKAPVVAVLDTGVDYNHPVVHDALWTNPDPTTDALGQTDVHGWDFVSGDPRPYDDLYHGTEVASVVLAVAPHARIMPLKVFNPWGITSSGAIFAAFQYAIQHGAKVIVCGWATRLPSQALSQAVQRALQAGVVVVAAAGDRGDNLDEIPAFPASLAMGRPNVLSVTGVDASDKLVQVQGHFANVSSTAVKLAAPGAAIQAADPRGGYARADSTGLAAAIAAGAVARIWAGNPELSYAGVLALIRAQAQVVPALASSVEGGLRLRIAD
jgi:hypothetical protein